MSMKLGLDPMARTIALRMGCGERLSLYQTQALHEQRQQQSQTVSRKAVPPNAAERGQ